MYKYKTHFAFFMTITRKTNSNFSKYRCCSNKCLYLYTFKNLNFQCFTKIQLFLMPYICFTNNNSLQSELSCEEGKLGKS